jgi:bacteriocin-like protein
MKKINLRGVLETLSEKKMKNVIGGSDTPPRNTPAADFAVGESGGYGLAPCGTPGNQPCLNKKPGDWCVSASGRTGTCKGWPAIPPCLICNLG